MGCWAIRGKQQLIQSRTQEPQWRQIDEAVKSCAHNHHHPCSKLKRMH